MVSTEACCERLLLQPAKTFVWGEVRHISEEQGGVPGSGFNKR